ncbi:MAG: inositol monophosphatase family protein [Pseudonocardiaceae bacterium]
MIDTVRIEQLLNVAKQATATAGEFIRSAAPHTLTKKGDRDFASDVDVSVERLVRNFLHQQTPDLGFLGEESGGNTEGAGLRWILDPIDGTINFLHGLPLCAVSLSLLEDDITLVGVVALPFLGLQYTASLGRGSYANDQRLRVSVIDTLDAALVSIDQYTFGADSDKTNQLRHRLLEGIASRVQRVRIFGTSAIDLVWTAHGRLDACIILGNKPWDTSAGTLIAREAGARLLDLDGIDHSITSSSTIAVTPSIEHQLMTVIHDTLAKEQI